MAITPPRALHVDGSNCFNRLPPIDTVTADNTSLRFTALDGPVVTVTDNFTNAIFTETCGSNGGCAAGDRGRVSGTNIPYIANQLNGTITAPQPCVFRAHGLLKGLHTRFGMDNPCPLPQRMRITLTESSENWEEAE